MEDAEARAEPAEQLVGGVLEEQRVSGVGQEVEVHQKHLLLLLFQPPGPLLFWRGAEGKSNTHRNSYEAHLLTIDLIYL